MAYSMSDRISPDRSFARWNYSCLNPIRFRFTCSSCCCRDCSSWRRYSKINRICSSCSSNFATIFSILFRISLWVVSISRIFINTSSILTLIFLALLHLSTFASCKTPSSVKTKGRYRCPPQLEVTICDLKGENSSTFCKNIPGQLKNYFLKYLNPIPGYNHRSLL